MTNGSITLLRDPAALPLHDKDALVYLREVERANLDLFHTSLPLWQRGKHERFFALLPAFDNYALKMSKSPGDHDGSRYLRAQEKLRNGLGQSLQWLAEDWSGPLTPPGRVDSQTVQEAFDFLPHAADYAVLVDYHRALKKDLVKVEADRQKRIVRFLPTAKLAANGAELRFRCPDALQADLIRFGRNLPALQELDQFLRQSNYSMKDSRITANSIIAALTPEFIGKLASLGSGDPRSLPHDSNFGLLSFGEFAALWRTLFGWSFIAWRASLMRDDCYTIQLIQRDVLAQELGKMAKLDGQTAGRFIDMLTFPWDRHTSRPDVARQPLFTCGLYVVWSSMLILGIQQPWEAMKLLYSNGDPALDEAREGHLLCMLKEVLETRGGYTVALKKKFTLSGQNGEIDLLAWKESSPGEVLLVEAKAILPAPSIVEVSDATDKIENGARQLEKAKQALGSRDQGVKQFLFNCFPLTEIPVTFHCLVVTHDGDVYGSYDPARIPHSSLLAMQELLTDKDFASPSVLETAARTRMKSAATGNDTSIFRQRMIAGTMYQIPETGGTAA